jgi:hypothetical protein
MEDRGIVLKQTLLFFYGPTLDRGPLVSAPQCEDIRAMRRANLLTCAE